MTVIDGTGAPPTPGRDVLVRDGHIVAVVPSGAGIAPLDVLCIATRNGAEALGLLDETGAIEPGKRADLLVLAADPTLDVRNTRTIELVIQNGRVIEPLDLMPPGSTSREGRNSRLRAAGP